MPSASIKAMLTIMTTRLTYTELCKRKTFGDRFAYVSLAGKQHESPRFMSNPFYKSRAWLLIRQEVIRRDAGCDLGVLGVYIDGPIFVHHMNPLTKFDVEDWNDDMLNPEYLICVSEDTHNKIHYAKEQGVYIPREPGDTKLW